MQGMNRPIDRRTRRIRLSAVVVATCLIGPSASLLAQGAPTQPPPVSATRVTSATIPLWPQGTPGAKGTDPQKDIPTLTVYLPRPELATGAAGVICPGGGYGMLAIDHEGKQVAEWLNSLGVAGFILKYRLGPRYHHPAMLEDAGRAIRTVRAGGVAMGSRSPQDRDHRFFSGRPSRVDGGHPF